MTVRHEPVPPVTRPQRWREAPDALLGIAARDLDAGGLPRPTVAAFDGDVPLALVTLRRFDAGELVQALLEVLALLVPIGADRLALALPGRAWSLDDPVPPVCDDVDLRTRVIVLATADGRERPCAVSAVLRPFEVADDGRWCWSDPVDPEDAPMAPAIWMLATLLDAREELVGTGSSRDLRLASQLARVLLLGHELVLAPMAADRLERATTA